MILLSYTIFFLMERYSTDNCIQKLDNYDYWKELVTEICKTATSFEIRRWSDDPLAIETGERFGKRIENNEIREVIYKGDITKEFILYILSNYLTKDEYKMLKWFTINFYIGDIIVFSSGHWGTEPCLYNIDESHIEEIKNWAKKFPEILRIDVCNNNTSILG